MRRNGADGDGRNQDWPPPCTRSRSLRPLGERPAGRGVSQGSDVFSGDHGPGGHRAPPSFGVIGGCHARVRIPCSTITRQCRKHDRRRQYRSSSIPHPSGKMVYAAEGVPPIQREAIYQRSGRRQPDLPDRRADAGNGRVPIQAPRHRLDLRHRRARPWQRGPPWQQPKRAVVAGPGNPGRSSSTKPAELDRARQGQHLRRAAYDNNLLCSSPRKKCSSWNRYSTA